MNPIFATGIVSAGKDLIQNLSAPSSKPDLIPAGKFSTELRKAELSKELSASALRDDFLEIDQVKEFLAADSGSEIHLEGRADGSIQLVSSSGRRLIFDAGTQTCNIGQNLLKVSIANQTNISLTRPNAILLRD
jgi:hypothetical protein